MPAPKGTQPPAKGRGRPKGSPNKVQADVKAMVLEALSRVGGVDYLVTQAQTNPNSFNVLVGKVLPLVVAGDPKSPLAMAVTFVSTEG